MITLTHPAVVKRYDDAFAAGSDKQYPTLNLVRLELAFFRHMPGRLLDYGFGSGCNLIHLLECGYQVDALDTSPHAKRRVEQKLDARPDIAPRANLAVLGLDSERLRFDDATFDYVVCMSVLSLLSSRERVGRLLTEFHRVMKPGGKIIADINGPESEFVVYGTPLGDDVYEFRGVKGMSEPIPCYCPDTPEKFADLMNAYFAIDDVGFTAHKLFRNVEHEFIICAHRE